MRRSLIRTATRLIKTEPCEGTERVQWPLPLPEPAHNLIYFNGRRRRGSPPPKGRKWWLADSPTVEVATLILRFTFGVEVLGPI